MKPFFTMLRFIGCLFTEYVTISHIFSKKDLFFVVPLVYQLDHEYSVCSDEPHQIYRSNYSKWVPIFLFAQTLMNHLRHYSSLRILQLNSLTNEFVNTCKHHSVEQIAVEGQFNRQTVTNKSRLAEAIVSYFSFSGILSPKRYFRSLHKYHQFPQHSILKIIKRWSK